MAEVVAGLVSNVLEEATFDTTSERVLGWLTRRHTLMCSRSKCFRKKIVLLERTVEGQSAYALPAEVVEVREVQVAGVPYGNGRHLDIATSRLGYLWLQGLYVGMGGGVGTEDYDTTGAEQLSLVPAPLESGLSIEVWAICRPPVLSLTDDTTLKVPEEFYDALVGGAIGTGLKRLEARPDLAASFETEFAQACEELAEQVARRFRGRGPARIRVAGR